MWKFIFFHVALLLATVVNNVQSQDLPLQGMQGLRVTCDDKEKLLQVQSYLTNPSFEYLGMRDDQIDFFVTAKELSSFKEFLKKNHIRYEIFIDDVYQKAVKEFTDQLIHMGDNMMSQMSRSSQEYDFSYYMNYDQIIRYMEDLATNFKDIVKMIDIGRTYEGRPMYLLHISKPGRTNKPAIFIDAGIHAREWIAPATALYMIDQIIVNKTNNDLLNNVDFYILPVLNPDGYQYTHEGIENRLWRKTRSITNNSNCIGVDANRNFELGWMVAGASDNPCSSTFAGSKAFSEPETRNFRDFFLSKKGSIKVYLTLHSYGQYLLYPWGYKNELPANEPTLRRVAIEAAKAIYLVSKTKYVIGSSANVLYLAAGGSDDWAMGTGGAELSYTIELPGMRYGFILPAKHILPVGRETFEGLKVFIDYVKSKRTSGNVGKIPKISNRYPCRPSPIGPDPSSIVLPDV